MAPWASRSLPVVLKEEKSYSQELVSPKVWEAKRAGVKDCRSQDGAGQNAQKHLCTSKSPQSHTAGTGEKRRQEFGSWSIDK